MTTLATMSLKSVESLDNNPIDKDVLDYMCLAGQDEAHEIVLKLFLEEAKKNSAVNKKMLSRRSRIDPARVSKLLGASGNWTLGTMIRLLAALGYKVGFTVEKISDMRWDNFSHPLAVNPKKQQSFGYMNNNVLNSVKNNMNRTAYEFQK